MAQSREETAENRRAGERRNKVLFVRLDDGELTECKRAAIDGDVTCGEWARAVLVDAALRAKGKRAAAIRAKRAK